MIQGKYLTTSYMKNNFVYFTLLHIRFESNREMFDQYSYLIPKKDTHIPGRSQLEVYFVEIRGILENSAHFELTYDLSTILREF